MSVMMVGILGTYIAATVIDPSDDGVLKKAVKGTSAKLDRTIHKHAIENDHCYLCETNVWVLGY